MGKREFLKAVAGGFDPSHPVYGTPTSIACVALQRETGAYFPEAHLDPEKMAQLAASGQSILGFDVVAPLFSVLHEASAMGCDVAWGGPEAMPESRHPIFKDEDDIHIPTDLLKRPGCATPLEAIALLRKRLGDDAAVCGKVFGSWTQCYHYFGLEKFLIMTMDDPAKVHRILEKLLPVTIQFANAQLEAGADCIVIADHATRDLVSPQAYETFLKPLHARLAEVIDCPLILHICGDTSDRIGMIAETGLDSFHWDTKTGSPADVRQIAGDTLALIGGVSNMKLLRETPDVIATDTAEALEAGINVIGPECAVPLSTPLENLKAIARN